MSKFTKLKSMLMKKGKSAESAGAIAATIGRDKYGKSAMEKASAEHKPADSFSKKKY